MINAVSTTNSTTASAATSMKQDIGFNANDFMQLLVTQLKNQDPLNPQDSSQFVSQLAQLSQVEQTYNINTNLQNLLSSQNNITSLSAMSLIGKNVTTNELSGLVTAVKLDGNTPVLTVNGTDVQLTDVVKVGG